MKNKHYVWIWFLILNFGLIHFSYALQKIKVQDNETVSALLAQEGLTRIAISHDRIQEVRGPENRYQIQTDLKQGAVFLQPLPDTQNKPFTIFIASERHHNYVVHLTPDIQAADTILLKPKFIVPASEAHKQSPFSYFDTLTQLMTAMVNQTVPDGYTLSHPPQAQEEVEPSFTLKQIQIYRGKGLEGEVYQLQNRIGQTLHFSESQFYQQGDLAIALSSITLMPHGQLWLLKVKHHESTIASD